MYFLCHWNIKAFCGEQVSASSLFSRSKESFWPCLSVTAVQEDLRSWCSCSADPSFVKSLYATKTLCIMEWRHVELILCQQWGQARWRFVANPFLRIYWWPFTAIDWPWPWLPHWLRVLCSFYLCRRHRPTLAIYHSIADHAKCMPKLRHLLQHYRPY